ncbi:AfsR/SARP family transcriptional regulator [Amycolatopsis vancoresmycina]|uniref:AfsR/SARP family transcriptional regulator n=1 Tax=Amycolatopsis vancoresmycina TaxID=208444 RepID=UPI0003A0E261|nr:BTAD domain-containing putative transcriptional regulator [Amycolatopsis vancoresmycina]
MRFALLGAVEAQVSGRLVELGHARQQCVLTVLLVEANRPVSIDQLTERVWGGSPPARARDTLYGYVSHLRRVCAELDGAVIRRRSGGYVIDVDPAAVDLHRFRELVSRARAAEAGEQAHELFDEALGLWRGEPFANLDTYWLNGVREAVLNERRSAELDYYDLQLRQGNHAELLPTLSTRARTYPLDERVAGQLMLALYRCGRQAEALDHYRKLRAHLVSDLGADPGPELRELQGRILRNDAGLVNAGDRAGAARPAAGFPAPRQLPPGTRHFIGRSAELERLNGVLRRRPEPVQTVVITAIDGVGGVGKTALALHWAAQLRTEFPDGILHVNLRGYDPDSPPLDPAEVLENFLRALNVPPERIPPGLDAQAGLYRSLLDGRRVLVVLDNAKSADQVTPLLPGSPTCLVLITSRNRMSKLAIREGIHRVTLDVLPDADALALLGHVIGTSAIHADPEAAADVVRFCGRLPLALRIVAEGMCTRPSTTLADLAAELAAEKSRLDLLDTGDDESMAVRTVFSWSYRVLSPEAARVFRLLGLHAGGTVSLPAAAAMTGLPEGRVGRIVKALANVHLVEETTPGRYEFHDLLRLYAYERAFEEETEADRVAAVHRMLTWYKLSAAAADRLLIPQRLSVVGGNSPDVQPLDFTGYDQALEWCETERANLVAATRQAFDWREYETAWQVPAAMWNFFYLRKHWADQLAVYTTGLEAARRSQNVLGEGWCLGSLGYAYWDFGSHERAMEYFEQAMATCELIGQRISEEIAEFGRCIVRMGIGLVRASQGRFDEAVEQHQAALAIALKTGDRWTEGAVLGGLGEAFAGLRRYEQAVSWYERALDVRRQIDDRWGQAWMLHDLGEVNCMLEDFAAAVEYYKMALDLRRVIGDRQGEARTWDSMGDAARQAGSIAVAVDHWNQALTIFDDLDDPQAGEVSRKIGELGIEL